MTSPFKKKRRIVGGDLRGWDKIADALDVSVRTAERYEEEKSLPVHRTPGGGVYAHSCEIVEWHERNAKVAS